MKDLIEPRVEPFVDIYASAFCIACLDEKIEM